MPLRRELEKAEQALERAEAGANRWKETRGLDKEQILGKSQHTAPKRLG